MSQVGMDSQLIREISRKLDAEAKNLRSVVGRVEGLISQSSSSWRGADSQQFANSWQGTYKGKILRLIEVVESLADVAMRNAEDQERTSSTLGALSGAAVIAGAGGAFVASGLSQNGTLSVSGAYREGGTAAVGGMAVTEVGEAAGSAEAFLGARVNAKGEVGPDGISVGASAFSGTEASVEESVDVAGMHVQGNAQAFVGAKGEAAVAMTATGVSAGAGAFVGAKATASGSVDVGAVRAGGKAEAWAGMGFNANASATWKNGELKLGGAFGAGIGVGGQLSGQITIRPAEVVNVLPLPDEIKNPLKMFLGDQTAAHGDKASHNEKKVGKDSWRL